MGFISKIWKDRKTEYPNRRLLTKENGSTELVTVSREEGIISEEGSAFSAANMNDLEQRIKDAIGAGDIPEALGTNIIEALITLNSNFNALFTTKLITFNNIAINAGSYTSYTQDIAVNGYTPVAIAGYGATAINVIPYNVFINPASNQLAAGLINRGSSAVASSSGIKFQVRVLYVKNAMYSES